jgi:membrane protein YqaA with SNARE-associated domain
MRVSKNLSPILRVIMMPSRKMRKLYDWILKWSKTRYAKQSLFLLAFSESSFFPIPPDVLLIAMTVANRMKWWIFASIATIGSVLGGVAGYYIGVAFFESIGKPIINFYHLQELINIVGNKYSENSFFAVFTAALTPIPYKVFTIAGGVFRISLQDLIIASILGRGGRFFMVAVALRIFGKKISSVIEKYFDILSLIFIALIIVGFLLIRLFK